MERSLCTDDQCVPKCKMEKIVAVVLEWDFCDIFYEKDTAEIISSDGPAVVKKDLISWP